MGGTEVPGWIVQIAIFLTKQQAASIERGFMFADWLFAADALPTVHRQAPVEVMRSRFGLPFVFPMTENQLESSSGPKCLVPLWFKLIAEPGGVLSADTEHLIGSRFVLKSTRLGWGANGNVMKQTVPYRNEPCWSDWTRLYEDAVDSPRPASFIPLRIGSTDDSMPAREGIPMLPLWVRRNLPFRPHPPVGVLLTSIVWLGWLVVP